MPLGDAGVNEGLAIADPAEFAAELFRQLLEVRGIAVYGRQEERHTNFPAYRVSPSPRPARPTVVTNLRAGCKNQPLVLASYQSKPLLEDVRVINKVSQKLHAEILLRLLG